jgi:hypothetical protein
MMTSTISATDALAAAREDMFICPNGTAFMHIDAETGELRVFAEPAIDADDWTLIGRLVTSHDGVTRIGTVKPGDTVADLPF